MVEVELTAGHPETRTPLQEIPTNPSGVWNSPALEELITAQRWGWQTYWGAAMDERETMIAVVRTQDHLDTVLVERAEREAEKKAKQLQKR